MYLDRKYTRLLHCWMAGDSHKAEPLPHNMCTEWTDELVQEWQTEEGRVCVHSYPLPHHTTHWGSQVHKSRSIKCRVQDILCFWRSWGKWLLLTCLLAEYLSIPSPLLPTDLLGFSSPPVLFLHFQRRNGSRFWGKLYSLCMVTRDTVAYLLNRNFGFR